MIIRIQRIFVGKQEFILLNVNVSFANINTNVVVILIPMKMSTNKIVAPLTYMVRGFFTLKIKFSFFTNYIVITNKSFKNFF